MFSEMPEVIDMARAPEITVVERRFVVSLVQAENQDLANRVDEALSADDDPLVTALQGAFDRQSKSSEAQVTAIEKLGSDLRSELKYGIRWMAILFIFAIAANTALVGGIITFKFGGAQISTSHPVEAAP